MTQQVRIILDEVSGIIQNFWDYYQEHTGRSDMSVSASLTYKENDSDVIDVCLYVWVSESLFAYNVQ